jgi:osmoprotectant transport system permease protein
MGGWLRLLVLLATIALAPACAGANAADGVKTFAVTDATPTIDALQATAATAGRRVRIGSKRFTESYVLGEIATRSLARAGLRAEHRRGMGGTEILWGALTGGAIHAYPEYSGTLAEVILKRPGRPDLEELRTALAPLGIGITDALGFSNNYVLVMHRDRAAALGISRISDLRQRPLLAGGMSPEFLGRGDGWRALARAYDLPALPVRGVTHALGYSALVRGEIDFKEGYSTDAELARLPLAALEDDLGFFPDYAATYVYRLDAPAAAIAALGELAGTIPGERMIAMNASARETESYQQAAALYFGDGGQDVHRPPTRLDRVMRTTREHMVLVGISMGLAVLAGVPLGILAARGGWLGQGVLGTAGVVQTIPSLALLALLVPIPGLGISVRSAVLALFLYSLLPIIRATAAALQSIPPALRESADVLGLTPWARLLRVELPMASRGILAGVKTSTVINIGTATLAALIGAGGLGEPLIEGIDLRSPTRILEGAIPAALLALLAEGVFLLADRTLIPKGLRVKQRAGS